VKCAAKAPYQREAKIEEILKRGMSSSMFGELSWPLKPLLPETGHSEVTWLRARLFKMGLRDENRGLEERTQNGGAKKGGIARPISRLLLAACVTPALYKLLFLAYVHGAQAQAS
jgi:hypothetical protein